MSSLKFGLFSSSQGFYGLEQESWDDIVTKVSRNIPVLNYDLKKWTLSSKLVLRGCQGVDFWDRLPRIQDRWQSRLGKYVSDPVIDISYLRGILWGC